jgi:hypothetical protein
VALVLTSGFQSSYSRYWAAATIPCPRRRRPKRSSCIGT